MVEEMMRGGSMPLATLEVEASKVGRISISCRKWRRTSIVLTRQPLLYNQEILLLEL